MRGRFAVPVALLATVAVPVSSAQAGNKHQGHNGQKVSINVTPNPVVTGTPLAIYGQLSAADVSNRLVVLYHRIAGQNKFTIVNRTHTDNTGFYRFDRAEGVVRTNRNWYVKSAGARSRNVHEHVYSEVALAEPTAAATTNHNVAFTGTVTPGNVHKGDRVVLQQQIGKNGDKWTNVDAARIGNNGAYTINHKFGHASTKTVRVLLRADKYNLRSVSDPVTIDVTQAQRPDFTINSSSDVIDAGTSATITGTVAAPDNAGRTLTLFARNQAGGGFHSVGTTSTDGNGNYSFTQSPDQNTVYQVRSGSRHSAQLFEGVRDVVTVTASATTGHVNDVVTFTGSILPNKAGHVIYLEQKGDDGSFHVIQVRRVAANGSYTLSHKLSTTGTKVFRVLIPGGPVNARGVSAPQTIVVS